MPSSEITECALRRGSYVRLNSAADCSCQSCLAPSLTRKFEVYKVLSWSEFPRGTLFSGRKTYMLLPFLLAIETRFLTLII